MNTITERVAAGMAFLDEHDPQWWRADVERAIDIDELNLRSGNLCVLGQRCPIEADCEPYLAYASYLSEIPVSKPFTVDDWARPLGFQADNPDVDFDDLTDEWKRVITERRAAS